MKEKLIYLLLILLIVSCNKNSNEDTLKENIKDKNISDNNIDENKKYEDLFIDGTTGAS